MFHSSIGATAAGGFGGASAAPSQFANLWISELSQRDATMLARFLEQSSSVGIDGATRDQIVSGLLREIALGGSSESAGALLDFTGAHSDGLGLDAGTSRGLVAQTLCEMWRAGAFNAADLQQLLVALGPDQAALLAALIVADGHDTAAGGLQQAIAQLGAQLGYELSSALAASSSDVLLAGFANDATARGAAFALLRDAIIAHHDAAAMNASNSGSQHAFMLSTAALLGAAHLALSGDPAIASAFGDVLDEAGPDVQASAFATELSQMQRTGMSNAGMLLRRRAKDEGSGLPAETLDSPEATVAELKILLGGLFDTSTAARPHEIADDVASFFRERVLSPSVSQQTMDAIDEALARWVDEMPDRQSMATAAGGQRIGMVLTGIASALRSACTGSDGALIPSAPRMRERAAKLCSTLLSRALGGSSPSSAATGLGQILGRFGLAAPRAALGQNGNPASAASGPGKGSQELAIFYYNALLRRSMVSNPGQDSLVFFYDHFARLIDVVHETDSEASRRSRSGNPNGGRTASDRYDTANGGLNDGPTLGEVEDPAPMPERGTGTR